MTTQGHFLGELSALVGRCQSCRWSSEKAKPGVAGGVIFVCSADGLEQVTRGHWKCGRFEYEPGSLG